MHPNMAAMQHAPRPVTFSRGPSLRQSWAVIEDRLSSANLEATCVQLKGRSDI